MESNDLCRVRTVYLFELVAMRFKHRISLMEPYGAIAPRGALFYGDSSCAICSHRFVHLEHQRAAL